MRFRFVALCAISTAIGWSAPAEPLTLERALAIAKSRAPAVRVARADAERKAALAMGDALLLPDNPEVEIAGGRRGEGSFGDEYELSLVQPLSGLASYSRRSALANATAAFAGHEADAAERALLLDVAGAFLRASDGQRRVAIARDLSADAVRMEDALRARFEAGDVARIELNIARAEALRANARAAGELAELLEASASLRALLGLTDDAPLELIDESSWVPPRDGDRESWIASSPTVRAIEREREAARAEADLSGAFFATEWALGVSASKEEGENVFEAGVGVTLPVFERRQAARAAATARLRQAESEREGVVARLGGEIDAASSSLQLLRESMDSVDQELIPLLEENVALATESWEAGRIGLIELLLVRREFHEARMDRSETFRKKREAEVRLRFLMGDLP